jgi:hypothetical protein
VNTIQVVLDHAPPEIAELTEEIIAMEERLRDARARKQVLEQLLAVLQPQGQDLGRLTLVGKREEQVGPRRAAAGASS